VCNLIALLLDLQATQTQTQEQESAACFKTLTAALLAAAPLAPLAPLSTHTPADRRSNLQQGATLPLKAVTEHFL